MLLRYAEPNVEGELTEVRRTYGVYILVGAIKFRQIDAGE